ncbi:hypothetical protein [Antarctobacter sp.]|uniref:DUF7249 family protein n=1 Tax=Antarctobacter sp. TaxID=1872577 RepID=UPI002B26E64D|nr:hypothetical protein [Antarctobacter sp.]
MKPETKRSDYNGHRNWNAWRIAVEFSNDQGLYLMTCDLVDQVGIGRAAEILGKELSGQRTSDGAVFNRTAIRLALRHWR